MGTRGIKTTKLLPLGICQYYWEGKKKISTVQLINIMLKTWTIYHEDSKKAEAQSTKCMAHTEATIKELMPKDHRLSAGQGQVERFHPSTSSMGNCPTRCCSKEM